MIEIENRKIYFSKRKPEKMELELPNGLHDPFSQSYENEGFEDSLPDYDTGSGALSPVEPTCFDPGYVMSQPIPIRGFNQRRQAILPVTAPFPIAPNPGYLRRYSEPTLRGPAEIVISRNVEMAILDSLNRLSQNQEESTKMRAITWTMIMVLLIIGAYLAIALWQLSK